MKRTIMVMALLALPGCFAGCPGYTYMRQSEGEGSLAQSAGESQVRINQAKANLEVAKLAAESEIARAHGVAEANRIIGASLKENEAYLRWLWIKGLEDNNQHQIIYIPT